MAKKKIKYEEWKGYKNWKLYDIEHMIDFIKDSIHGIENDYVISKTTLYWNHPCSFDIEVTSWESEAKNETLSICGEIDKMIATHDKTIQKYATMYVWQFGMNGNVIYGRTWYQFGALLENIDRIMQLDENKRIIIYSHNLSYEFQHMRNWFDWSKVFASKKRRPIYAITYGFEFRCSYFLSNYSLEYLGNHMLHKYPIEKLVGFLDYSKKRHSDTPLTQDELAYCINDVRVVMAYIQEKIEEDGDIGKIPLTNTGYVRKYCRDWCFYGNHKKMEDRLKNQYNYKALMSNLTIDTVDEYNALKRAFIGGFTHAGLYHARQNLYNVGSADLASSYPYCMVAEYFPMGKPLFIENISLISELTYYLNNYCCVFDIEFTNLNPKWEYENYIPVYGSTFIGNYASNNNKVISADCLRRTITELDFDIIQKTYVWDSIKVINMYCYEKGYLPRDFIIAILNLYEKKTSLKGVFGRETEYMVAKNMINAGYGMMVTAIIRAIFEYLDGWNEYEANVDEQLSYYNKNFNRFLSYAWGVYVTAHARHNLWEAILEFGEDYVYADTDSIKGLNFDKHMAFFEKYNENVVSQLTTMCQYYEIDFKKCQPETIEGEKKIIGVWEIEEGYKVFKTLGAKRYLYIYESGFCNMTVSGVNKKFAMPYLIAKTNKIDYNSEEYKILQSAYRGEDKDAIKSVIGKNYEYMQIFAIFDDGLFIPAGYTGKQLLTYIDSDFEIELTDYLGNTSKCYEKSAIHMEEESYYISIVGDYLRLLFNIKEMNMNH